MRSLTDNRNHAATQIRRSPPDDHTDSQAHDEPRTQQQPQTIPASARSAMLSPPCGGWPGRPFKGFAREAGIRRARGRVSGPSEPRARHGLIFGLIRLRSPTFGRVRINAVMQVADVNGIRRTIIQVLKNRKVGGSSPAPAICNSATVSFGCKSSSVASIARIGFPLSFLVVPCAPSERRINR